MINADLVNNLGNLVNRGTVKKLNPKQKYPSFDVEVMEHELKGTGEKLVLELKALPGTKTDTLTWKMELFNRGYGAATREMQRRSTGNRGKANSGPQSLGHGPGNRIPGRYAIVWIEECPLRTRIELLHQDGDNPKELSGSIT